MQVNPILDDLKKWNANENNLSFEEGFLDRKSGHNKYIYIRQTENSKKNSIVVFAHATGNDLLYPFLSLFKQVAENGHDIFTFDIDGHGSESTSYFDKKEVLGCLPTALEQVRLLKTYTTIHLLGQSLGGVLALDYVKAHHENISSLTLISVPTQLDINFKTTALESLSLLSPSFLGEIKAHGFNNSFPAFGPFKRKTYPVRLTDDTHYTKEIKNFINSVKITSQLAKLDCSTLLCYGRLDLLSPVSQGEELHDKISNSKLVVAELENHFTTLFSPKINQAIMNHIEDNSDDS